MFAGHTQVLGGPHVARGPDVAQACPKDYTNWLNVVVVQILDTTSE